MAGSRSSHSLDPRQAGALRLDLLGPPRVLWHGEVLQIPRGQVRAVLYYLALHQRAISAEHLRFLLWPDAPDRAARRRLSHLLTHLRRSLPAPAVLEQGDSMIALAPRHIRSDVAAFRRIVAHAVRAGDRSGLRYACDLYRGPLLDGVALPTAEFEHEIQSERRELERLLLAGLRALMDEELASGNSEAVMEWAHRYLTVDEVAEDIHGLLMGLYADLGSTAQTLRQQRWLTEALERELGARPSPEALIIRRDVLGPGPDRPGQIPRPRPGYAPDRATPFVGREQMLARIHHVFEQACRGHGGMLLISGETGIGKTRLLGEYALRLHGSALILMGSCYPGSQEIPYGPVAQIGRQLADATSTLGLGTMPSAAARRHHRSPSDPRVATWLSRTRSMRPFMAADLGASRLIANGLLAMSAGPRTILVCLEDLQWADDASLRWLGELAARIRDHRLVVLGTYCCVPEGKLADQLGQWSNSAGLCGDLKLPGLDSPGILRLLRMMRGMLPGDVQLARRLLPETGGNPLYLVEGIRASMRHCPKEGDPAPRADLPVTDTLWKAIMCRLGHLDPRARQTLEAVSQLRASFTTDEAAGVIPIPGRQVATALHGLVGRHVLLEEGSGYRFRHELVRRVVRTSLDPRLYFEL